MLKNDIEFYQIVEDIIKHKEFIKLKDELHHGISRLDHSINVAKISYYLAKKFNLKNYDEITRAALLHDFYLDKDIDGKTSIFSHAKLSAYNAVKYFDIDYKQYNVIESHMFPFNRVLPLYKESWIVNLSDKFSAVYECVRYKVPLKAGIASLFLINLLLQPIYK